MKYLSLCSPLQTDPCVMLVNQNLPEMLKCVNFYNVKFPMLKNVQNNINKHLIEKPTQAVTKLGKGKQPLLRRLDLN